MKYADLDEGRRSDGLTTAEREELVQLRRELKVAKLKNEILKRAAAQFRVGEFKSSLRHTRLYTRRVLP